VSAGSTGLISSTLISEVTSVAQKGTPSDGTNNCSKSYSFSLDEYIEKFQCDAKREAVDGSTIWSKIYAERQLGWVPVSCKPAAIETAVGMEIESVSSSSTGIIGLGMMPSNDATSTSVGTSKKYVPSTTDVQTTDVQTHKESLATASASASVAKGLNNTPPEHSVVIDKAQQSTRSFPICTLAEWPVMNRTLSLPLTLPLTLLAVLAVLPVLPLIVLLVLVLLTPGSHY